VPEESPEEAPKDGESKSKKEIKAKSKKDKSDNMDYEKETKFKKGRDRNNIEQDDFFIIDE